MAFNVALGCTEPVSVTAAAAPVVVYLMTVVPPPVQRTIATPAVVLFEQPPVPVPIGSWYTTSCVPPRPSASGYVTVTVLPASTVPDVGEPEIVDWQPVSVPAKLYVNALLVAPSPGENSALPDSW